MQTAITKLREFHEKYGHFISDTPNVCAPASVVQLRCNLIAEEAAETMSALFDLKSAIMNCDSAEERMSIMEEVLDGICDTIYVLVGTAVSLGLPLDAGFAEVHRSNMTKTPPDAGRANDPGLKYSVKTPKGPNFSPPDFASLLKV